MLNNLLNKTVNLNLTSANFSAIDQFDIVSIVNVPFVGGFFTNISLLIVQLGFIWAAILAWGFATNVNSSALSASNFIAHRLTVAARQMFESNSEQEYDAHFFVMAAVFFCVFTANFFGLLPFAATATSYLAVTLFFSGMNFFSNLYMSFRIFGLSFFANLIPAGTPDVLRGFMVLVESISFVTRLFSLAIRLFANMVAGHAMLKVMVAIMWTLFASLGPVSGVVLALLMVVLAAVTILEVTLSFLQAYVFVLLGGVYLNEAVSRH